MKKLPISLTLASILLVCVSSVASADYLRVGGTTAMWTSWGVIGNSQAVDRVQMPDGRFYEIQTLFDRVTEYQRRGDQGRCWVKIREFDWPGLLGYAGSALRAARGSPRFFNGSQFISDSVETLTFLCVRRS